MVAKERLHPKSYHKKGLRDLRDQQPLGMGQKPPKNQICFASGNRNIYIYMILYLYLIYPLRSSLMSMPQKSLGLLLTKWLSDGVVYIKDCDFQYIIYQKVTKSNLWGYIYSHRSWYSKKKVFFEEDPYLWQHAWKNRVSEKRPTNLWVHAADGINRKCSSIYIYL